MACSDNDPLTRMSQTSDNGGTVGGSRNGLNGNCNWDQMYRNAGNVGGPGEVDLWCSIVRYNARQCQAAPSLGDLEGPSS